METLRYIASTSWLTGWESPKMCLCTVDGVSVTHHVAPLSRFSLLQLC